MPKIKLNQYCTILKLHLVAMVSLERTHNGCVDNGHKIAHSWYFLASDPQTLPKMLFK